MFNKLYIYNIKNLAGGWRNHCGNIFAGSKKEFDLINYKIK